jgi:hypothetical protein
MIPSEVTKDYKIFLTFSDVMANLPRNRDAIKLWHKVRGVSKNVSNNSHAMLRRVDVCVSDHEFF